jgi:methylenetetrahydrofolate reductase (NADPH)
MSLQPVFETGKFVVTSEIGPSKGTDVSEIPEIAHLLRGKIDAANVTDQQTAVMRMSSLAVCHLLKENGLEPVLQMTTRDRNRIALQSDLLGAWALGIENVLSIAGDLPALGDHPQAKPVYDLDSVQLLEAIKTLNEGHDMVGKELKGKPNFFAGAAVNPGADTEAAYELQLIRMEKKVAAGAKFFQTQAVYDPRNFEKFMQRAQKFNVPVLAGIIPLKSAGMARNLNKFVAGIFVPDDLINRMAKAEDKTKTGIEIAANLIKDMKGLCSGVHVMATNWEKKIPEILAAAGLI